MNEQDNDEQFYEDEMLSATEREATVREIQDDLKVRVFGHWYERKKEMKEIVLFFYMCY